MNFNKHFDLVGKHAFLSASSYHWINYEDEKLDEVFKNAQAAALGSALHDFAHQAVSLRVKLPKVKKTLNLYVNDVIGHRMTTEQILFYSENCFGTADAISFKNNVLRIFDLKTGVTRASINQVLVYAALFCLEYGVKPGTIRFDLRIYKDDEVQLFDADVEDVLKIMDTIIRFDQRIENIKTGGA